MNVNHLKQKYHFCLFERSLFKINSKIKTGTENTAAIIANRIMYTIKSVIRILKNWRFTNQLIKAIAKIMQNTISKNKKVLLYFF